MLDIVNALIESLQAGRPLVYCRLVETRGSTPQKAGASMLVFEDASQVGTLGGGCVEAEVKRRALAALQRGGAEIARFNLDSDYGWDDGLICGGRMHVLIDPLRPSPDGDDPVPDYFQRLRELRTTGQGGTEAIVFSGGDADELAEPVSYLFDHSGASIALRGAARESITPELRPLDERPRAYVEQGVSYMPFYPRYRLLIVGAGHVGQSVAQLAVDLDFDVWVVDDREDLVSEQRFPRAERRISGSIAEVLSEIEVTTHTYCLIVTRGHNHDQEALYQLADRGACYVGMIGSRRKIRLIYDDLIAEGISADVLDAVHAPVGLDIGSQSVAEIAVSIAAELIAHRNCGGQVPARPRGVSVSPRGSHSQPPDSTSSDSKVEW